MNVGIEMGEPLNVTQKYRKLIYLSALLNYEAILGPILVIFYLQYMGLSFSQYCVLDGLLCILLAIFEVPSGYIADLFGRKKSLLISLSLVCISMIILVVLKNFVGALIAVVIQGIFSPLGSGNAEAIYFETFKKYKKEEELQKIYSKQNSIMFIGLTIMSIVSGLLATINLVLPMIVSITLLIINIFLYLILLNDTKVYEKKNMKIKIVKSNIVGNSIKNFKIISNTTSIFIVSAILFCSTRVAYTFYQPLLGNINIDVKYFGIVFAFFNIIGFVISLKASKIFKVLKTENNVFLLLSTLIIVSFLGISTTNSKVLILFFIVLQQIVRGLHFPYFAMRKNYYIPPESDYRVTYLSYSNLINTLLLSMLLGVFSILNERMALISSIKYLGIITSIIILISIVVHNLLKRKGSIICYQCQE